MKKKTLKEKIKSVCRWTLVFMVLYFIVGAFFLSDGPNFDPAKAYDLIKDTLTLSASFLAPVAAIVLFSDWREEYNFKNTITLMENIKEQSKNIEKLLIDYRKNIIERKIEVGAQLGRLADSELVARELIELSFSYRELGVSNKNIIDFKVHVEEFYDIGKRINKILSSIDENSIIPKQYESLNIKNNNGEQIHPIPGKDKFENEIVKVVYDFEKLALCLNQIIEEISEFKINL